MALKLVRIKQAKLATSRKKSQVEKFTDAIDVQIRLASGEKVKKGKGYAQSWMQDGTAYGEEKVLIPRVGATPLYAKSAIAVDMKQKSPPANELKELRAKVVAGKLNNQINTAARKRKKTKPAKKQ